MRTHAITIVVTALLMMVPVATSLGQVADEIVLWGDDAVKPITRAANYDPDSAVIALDNTVFFEIRNPAVGYSVAERERIIHKRIVEIFSRCSIAPVYVDHVRGQPTIYVDRMRLVTVYPADVAAHEACCAQALAERWAGSVAAALKRTAPLGCVSGPNSYAVGMGGSVLFRLMDAGGYATIQQRGHAVDRNIAAIAADFDPELVAITPVPRGIAVTYDGQAVVVATEYDAAPRGMSPEGLASAWAENLRRMLPRTRH